MIHTISAPIDSSGRSTREVAAALRGPRLEWDSLSMCMIPVALGNDRQPDELARGDVMLSGPWGFRGDMHEARESDRHERLRRAVLGALGFYDWHRRPAFELPEYAWRRARALEILASGVAGAAGAAAAFGSPPVALPWHCTSADDCYDARYEATIAGGKVTILGDQGTRNLDATNVASTLTLTSSWSGVLSAVTGTGVSTDRLTCAGTASQWRIHSGNAWSVVTAHQVTSVAAVTGIYANRATPSASNELGMGCCYTTAGTGDFRIRVGSGSAAVNNSAAGVPAGTLTRVVVGWRYTTGLSSTLSRRSLGQGSSTQSDSSSPSDTDAGVLSLCAGTGGTAPIIGHLAHLTAHQLNSAGWLQSLVDHLRALGRI